MIKETKVSAGEDIESEVGKMPIEVCRCPKQICISPPGDHRKDLPRKFTKQKACGREHTK